MDQWYDGLMVQWIDGTTVWCHGMIVRWLDGMMAWMLNGMMAQWYDAMAQWLVGTMAWWYNGLMVQWLDGYVIKDEDKDKEDNDDLVFWHNKQPCGRMHSCHRGDRVIFNNDKNKDNRTRMITNYSNNNEPRKQTMTTNYNDWQQPTLTTTNNKDDCSIGIRDPARTAGTTQILALFPRNLSPLDADCAPSRIS